MILLTLSRGKGEETVRLQLPASPAEIGETFAFLDRISLDTTATAILDVSSNVSVVRELAKYMNSVGEQAYLLPLQLTKKTGRHIPYIYSKEDLSKLFKEMDSLQPSLRSPTKHLVVFR